MWKWLKEWFPIQFRWGDLQEKEKDMKVKGFVLKLWRLALGVVIYVDQPEPESE